MGLFRQAVLFLVAAVAVRADVEVYCGRDAVRVRWREVPSDPSLLLLGDCPPSKISHGDVMFNAYFYECNFRRMVTKDTLLYLNELTYSSGPSMAISRPVVCAYERAEDWEPSIYEPVFQTFAQVNLVFHIGIMNEDFTGPAASSVFAMGSLIPIRATVEQVYHQPLLLLLEECVATTSPELQPENVLYQIISNKGCLVDSKTGLSRFQPRVETSQIDLQLQAFKFPLGQDIYIHCKLVAWNPQDLDSTRKACHFKGQGWELLDDPNRSSLCSCCDSTCSPRKTRSLASGNPVVTRNMVLGPLTIVDPDS